MKFFLRNLAKKNIHIIGVTGAEGSSLLHLFAKHKFLHLSVHDWQEKDQLEKNFKLWHQGITERRKEELYQQFLADLRKTRTYFGKNYLRNIDRAGIIFVPQSWRLYKENTPLTKIKNIPFYSLTRLYLDFAPAQVVAITGTVGKGSTAFLLVQLLEKAGKKVYFAGNETWREQVADKIDQMKEEEILVLEISHRQLQEGFSRPPKIAVITNLYPNHLDEVSWQKYQKLKFSLFQKQTADDFSVLNYDLKLFRNWANYLLSKVVFFSAKNYNLNIEIIRKFKKQILNIKSVHFEENILAALTTASILGIKVEQIIKYLPTLSSLPSRLECLGQKSGVYFYNDLKSTTPWATLAALPRLPSRRIFLVCGGETKGIDYREFAQKISRRVKKIVILSSELSKKLSQFLPSGSYFIFSDLKEALFFLFQKAKKGDIILVSPAAAFFYRFFVKNKESLRKIFTSLPPKEPA